MQARHTAALAGRAAGGFTLVELVIAVGAVTLLSLAIAGVFSAVGRTVETGRRVSQMNAQAALIERQLREDLSRITRQGCLVITNEMTGDGSREVDLYPGDPNPRSRRIDQLMFFATGDYTSARTPLDPSLIARAEAARIYYGHGVRLNDAELPVTLEKDITFEVDDPNYLLGEDHDENPNRYASGWVLIRQQTLLRHPDQTLGVLPASPPYGLSQDDLIDGDQQVAGLPAMSSLSRRLATIFPEMGNIGAIYDGYPISPSGLVDIATTDLSEVRAIICTTSILPTAVKNFSDFAGQPTGRFLIAADDPTVLPEMQAWMIEMLPSNSTAFNEANRRRVRCELEPPDFLFAAPAHQGMSELEEAISRADQMMLTASNLAPRCTEFIVEWSFGDTIDDAGSMLDGSQIWHGMERRTMISGQEEFISYPYDPAIAPMGLNYRTNDGRSNSYQATRALIHGVGAIQNPDAPVISYFGYYDPTFDPDRNTDGDTVDPGDAAAPTLPWIWPKLIRITLTLAAPNDPDVQQTYQFVIELPQSPST